MRITARVVLGNLLIGLLPILGSLLLVLFILDSQSRNFVDNTMNSTLDGVKNYIQADQQKYSDFSLFLKESIPAVPAETSFESYRRIFTNQGVTSVNRLNIRLYEVFFGDRLVDRNTYSWKDNPYFTPDKEASQIWQRLQNPLYQRWQVVSIPALVSNMLVVRHCSIIIDSGQTGKIGFVALSVPIDRDYLSAIPLPGSDAIAYVLNENGGTMGREDFQRDDILASLRVKSKTKEARVQIFRWKGLGEFYSLSAPLFRDQQKISNRTIQKDIARVGVLYRSDALVQDMVLLRRTILLIFIFVVVAIGGLAILMARTVTNPIRRLNRLVNVFRSSPKPIDPPAKVEDELSSLHQSISEMSGEIVSRTEELRSERNRLHLRNEEMEKDLEMAMRIQRRIIPTHSPFREIAFRYIPMEKVGGDFYDIIRIRESSSEYGIFVSDVSGHGVSAAFVTSMIKSMILQAGEIRKDPALLLLYLNRLLLENTAGNFVTAFYAIYTRETRTLTYSNAGHNLPFVINDEGVSQLKVSRNGTPLSILSADELHTFGRDYSSNTVTLEPGSKVLFYTDGLSEAVGVNDPEEIKKDFEESVLKEVLHYYRALSSDKYISKLVEELLKFRGSEHFDDDVALVCLSVE